MKVAERLTSRAPVCYALLMPRISIVMPSFNSGRYIEEALRSVVAQRCDPVCEIELIVVDGGSNDNTPAVLERYRGAIARLIVEPDHGPAAAINKGMRLAGGDILAWLNADDRYHPGALERVAAAFARRPERRFCFGHCRIVDEDGREIRRNITRCKEACFPLACRPLIQTLNFVSQPSLFFTRRAWEGAGALREEMLAAFDYEFLLRLWRQGGSMRLARPPLADFRWHAGSISGGGFERQFREEWEAAAADAGRWAPQTLLHAGVRRTIVACYRGMAHARRRACPVASLREKAPPAAGFHLGVNALFLIPGAVGGCETYLTECLRALLPLHNGRVTLFTNRENDALLRSLGAHCGGRVCCELLDFSATSRPARILREQWQLPERVRRRGCDVLWSPGYTAPLRMPCPQVVTIHDMQYRRYPADLAPLAWLATHLLVTQAVRRCDLILAVSSFTANEIAKFARAQRERIRVVAEGVAPCFAAAAEDATPRAADSAPYLLCVANSYPHKNLPALVAAFEAVAADIPHDLLLVGGAGRGERALAAALQASRWRARVRRRRGLTRAEMARAYRDAALFVFPSLYEGFGLPVLEAMAAGAPVLTTRCGAIPEVGGEAVAYCDPRPAALAAAMKEELARPAAERARRVQAARARAATFTWESAAAATLRVLAEAAGH